MSITNEKIECICCYHENIIAIDAFIKCKATPRHLICQKCYTDWGSNTCFFCNPLHDKPIYIRVQTQIDSNIIINIDERNNAEINLQNIDLSINEFSNESPDNIYKFCCFNEDIWNEICNILYFVCCLSTLSYLVFAISYL